MPRQHRKIPVLIRDQDWDDVMGQGGGYFGLIPEGEDVEGQGARYGGLGQTEDDAQGQVYILKRPHPGEQLDDVEGHPKYRIRLEGDDAEGGRAYLVPATDDDVEGHGGRYGKLRPVEDDTEGSGLKWRLEPDDDTEGQARRPWPEDSRSPSRGGGLLP